MGGTLRQARDGALEDSARSQFFFTRAGAKGGMMGVDSGSSVRVRYGPRAGDTGCVVGMGPHYNQCGSRNLFSGWSPAGGSVWYAEVALVRS